MMNKIGEYQRAYNVTVENLKNNSKVRAIFVFGSMVTGDLWENSDIDILIIADIEDKNMKHIYCKENEVDVHIRALGTERFLEVYETQLEGGYIHRLLCSSKMVYCNDSAIVEMYDNCRLIPDIYREMWNMVFIGRLIKLLKETKKYISKGNLYTVTALAHKAIEEYSKLFVSMYGYVISKDVINMATSLNEQLNNQLKGLYSNRNNLIEEFKMLTEFLDTEINKNIERVSYVMIEKIKEAEAPLSSEDIRKSKEFKEYDINVEAILNRLYKLGIIKLEERDLANISGGLKEKVYFV